MGEERQERERRREEEDISRCTFYSRSLHPPVHQLEVYFAVSWAKGSSWRMKFQEQCYLGKCPAASWSCLPGTSWRETLSRATQHQTSQGHLDENSAPGISFADKSARTPSRWDHFGNRCLLYQRELPRAGARNSLNGRSWQTPECFTELCVLGVQRYAKFMCENVNHRKVSDWQMHILELDLLLDLHLELIMKVESVSHSLVSNSLQPHGL